MFVYYSTILVSGIGLKGKEVEGQIKDNLQIEEWRSVAIRRRQSRSAFFCFFNCGAFKSQAEVGLINILNILMCIFCKMDDLSIVLGRSSGEALHC